MSDVRPLLSINMYNRLLTLDVPTNVVTIRFGNKFGLTNLGFVDEIEIYANETVYDIKSWLENAGLSLTEQKTEVPLSTKRRKSTSLKIKVGTHIIHS